ncbi:MAG TPA: DUF1127 domain-containing protein [Paracoccaceae bacterium]|nr:DUF1127 domain-containing protein [Paracoccaceae bacterium]
MNMTRALTAGLGERAAALVASVREGLRRRAVYTQTLRELRALSNRELSDLGIDRSMITRIALEAAYGK